MKLFSQKMKKSIGNPNTGSEEHTYRWNSTKKNVPC